MQFRHVRGPAHIPPKVPLVRVAITTGVVGIAPEKRRGNGRELWVKLDGTGERGGAGEEDHALGLLRGTEGGREMESIR